MSFVSNVYANPGEESAPGPGEIDRSRVWDKGKNEIYLGKCNVGDAEWFKTGRLPKFDPPVPLFADCCAKVTTTPCTACVGGIAPFFMPLTVQGMTGDYSGSNGIFLVPNVGKCHWELLIPTGFLWQIFGIAPGAFELLLFDPDGVELAEYGFSNTAWECANPIKAGRIIATKPGSVNDVTIGPGQL